MRREKKNSHEKKMRKRISDRTTTLEFHNELRLILNYYYFDTNMLSQNNSTVYAILMLRPFDILASSNRATKRSFDKISSSLPLFCFSKKAIKPF